jgi:hypothetical protein
MTVEQEAQDPTTKPERLEAIYLEEYSLRHLVAKNPNTPHHLFMLLGDEYPQEVFENPGFQLMFLENPNAIESFPVGTVWTLSKVSSLPEWFIFLLATYPNDTVKIALTKRKELTPELLERLAAHHNPQVRKVAALSPHTPLKVLEQLYHDTQHRFAHELVQNPSTPSYMLHKLSFEHVDFALAVARHQNTSQETIAQLVHHNYYSVRYEVILNPNIPPEVLEMLAKSQHREVRKKVATNPNTPHEHLQRLTTDEDEDVRKAAKKTVEKLKQ